MVLSIDKTSDDHIPTMNPRLDPNLNFREMLELEEVESKVQSSQVLSKFPDFHLNHEKESRNKTIKHNVELTN